MTQSDFLRFLNTLPAAAALLTFERPGQIRCDPPPVEPAYLRSDLGTVNGAVEMVCVKSYAVGQWLSAIQGLRVAPSDVWQATLAICQIPIQRRAFPFAK